MPLRICSFESRRHEEMRSLIERQGAEATVVPSMRELPLDSNAAVFAFAELLMNGGVNVVVFLTGVGAKTLLEVVETRYSREEFLTALRTAQVAVRGPKPTAVLREWNVPIAVRAAEPNTWVELVAALDTAGAIPGKRIAIQEYGKPNPEFLEELRRRGAVVQPVPVYRWALPEDPSALHASIRDTIAGRFDVLLFTSAHQLDCVLEVAESAGAKDDWVQAAQSCVIGSIGPTASEAIREHGLPVDLEAQPTRMGQLVKAAIEMAPAILAAKHPNRS